MSFSLISVDYSSSGRERTFSGIEGQSEESSFPSFDRNLYNSSIPSFERNPYESVVNDEESDIYDGTYFLHRIEDEGLDISRQNQSQNKTNPVLRTSHTKKSIWRKAIPWALFLLVLALSVTVLASVSVARGKDSASTATNVVAEDL
jgi:hypothetical protein